VCAVHASGKFSETLQGHSLEMGKGISGWVAAYKRPMINTGPALDFQGIQGDFTSFTDALVVPITDGDETLGTISLYAEEPITYNHNEQSILQTLSGFLSSLILEPTGTKRSRTQDLVDPVTGLHYFSYLTALGRN